MVKYQMCYLNIKVIFLKNKKVLLSKNKKAKYEFNTDLHVLKEENIEENVLKIIKKNNISSKKG